MGPSFHAQLFAGGGLSFTFVGFADDTDTTIDLTSLSAGAIAAGDFCVIFNAAHSTGAAPTTVVPSGFTSEQNTGYGPDGGTSVRGIISAKILAGTETTLSGMNGSFYETWIAGVFRPSQAITGFAWNSGNGFAERTGPPEQTIAAAAATGAIIAVGHMSATTSISPRTTSPTMSEIGGTATSGHYAHYYLLPAEITYDMDDEGTQVMQSGYFTFT